MKDPCELKGCDNMTRDRLSVTCVKGHFEVIGSAIEQFSAFHSRCNGCDLRHQRDDYVFNDPTMKEEIKKVAQAMATNIAKEFDEE